MTEETNMVDAVDEMVDQGADNSEANSISRCGEYLTPIH